MFEEPFYLVELTQMTLLSPFSFPVTFTLDIPIYGLCPARDQFFVTNCDHCGQVVKYQALSAHIGMLINLIHSKMSRS